jgi:hypothetical protein
MRHNLPHFEVTENIPACPACGATATFTKTGDLGRDGRLYLIFKCTNCDAGEFKVWRPQWQAMTDLLGEDE